MVAANELQLGATLHDDGEEPKQQAPQAQPQQQKPPQPPQHKG
jgi:hypothetical protein